MGVQATVVFTDLHGSTGVFEALGNALATDAVTRTTRRIASQCEQHGGRVVKTLGDGVMVMFNSPREAIDAVVDIQREHKRLLSRTPSNARMPIRIGMASGDVELVGSDLYGDAVNVASRLCDLCGPHQIWSNAAALESLNEEKGVAFRILGPIAIRGRAEPCTVYQVEWYEDEPTDFLTMQGDIAPEMASPDYDPLGREIELSWLGTSKKFKSFDLPINVGRVRDVEFVVNDPRVSRTHARLEWRNGSVVLIDLSSYGSWVRFANSGGSDILLRREECVLHGQGELALGGPFTDPSVPTVHFSVK